MLSDPSSRRRLVLVVGVGIVLVELVGVAAYSLAVDPTETPSPLTETSTTAGTDPASAGGCLSPATTTAPPGDTLPSLPHTDDPALYARAVAETLLAWDTMSALTPDDHARHVLDDADPAGRETPALAGDVANYLPTLEVWQQLRHAVAVASRRDRPADRPHRYRPRRGSSHTWRCVGYRDPLGQRSRTFLVATPVRVVRDRRST